MDGKVLPSYCQLYFQYTLIDIEYPKVCKLFGYLVREAQWNSCKSKKKDAILRSKLETPESALLNLPMFDARMFRRYDRCKFNDETAGVVQLTTHLQSYIQTPVIKVE